MVYLRMTLDRLPLLRKIVVESNPFKLSFLISMVKFNYFDSLVDAFLCGSGVFFSGQSTGW